MSRKTYLIGIYGIGDVDQIKTLERRNPPTLKQLQKWVGGRIELLKTTGEEWEDDWYCNEEGRLLGLPYNDNTSGVLKQDVYGVTVRIMSN